jgi:hyperosmotically inducible periplasmic protein
MKTLQLLTVSALVAAVMTGGGCNRSETNANAERTAEQMKVAASRAKEQFADSWLTTKIQAQYFADEDIRARHINVSTRDGIVTLTGFVESPAERQQAVQTAQNTDGVRQVNDQLGQTSGHETSAVATSGTIAEPGSPPPATARPNSQPVTSPRIDDAQLTALVQSRFFVDDRVKARHITVDARNAVVTLSGDVASEEERGQVLLLARTTSGVERVEDHLTVNPAVAPVADQPASPARIDDGTLTTTIQAKFFIDPMVKGSAVDVSAKDGVVLLQGTVGDEATHQHALSVAQNTTGVLQVVDRLTVARSRR